MIYTAIDTFYLTEEQLRSSPSRRDGINEETETSLRIYGCDLIQESGILLRLPQVVVATGKVLFHRFYCKKSFARFSVKRVAASCVWLAGKLEESPRKSKHIIFVFHRMECRRENLPLEHLDVFSKKYSELKNDLIRTERHLLKELGFICHVEHPHKFISSYLATLEAPELTQEAWNLASDSLRTTLCVRFKSEVVACGVVYAAARRFQVALPEDPPWWTVFDADEAGIQEVCRVLAHLYYLPKAQYVPVYKDNDSFTGMSSDTWASKGSESNAINRDKATPKSSSSSQEKDLLIKAALDKLKEMKRSDEGKPLSTELEGKEDSAVNSRVEKLDVNPYRTRKRERDRSRAQECDSRIRVSNHQSKGRDSDRGRERDRKVDEWRHRSNDKGSGYSDMEKSRRHSSRDRGAYHSSNTSRDKDWYRHH